MKLSIKTHFEWTFYNTSFISLKWKLVQMENFAGLLLLRFFWSVNYHCKRCKSLRSKARDLNMNSHISHQIPKHKLWYSILVPYSCMHFLCVYFMSLTVILPVILQRTHKAIFLCFVACLLILHLAVFIMSWFLTTFDSILLYM